MNINLKASFLITTATVPEPSRLTQWVIAINEAQLLTGDTTQ